jgi:hypothetical protein
MNPLMLFVGLLVSSSPVVTSYQSVTKQTDSTPFYTSIGERVGMHVVAVSKDLLCRKAKTLAGHSFILCNRGPGCPDPDKLHYRDWVYIEGVGFRQVLDVMNPRHRNRFDVWVNSLDEEKKFGTKRCAVYLMWRKSDEKIQKNKRNIGH